MLFGFIAGNLGRDAELRQTQSGPVCSFSVATENRKGKGDNATVWIRCSMWGKRGEAVAPHLSKGTRVAVAGDLELHEYNGKTSLEMRVAELTMLGGKRAEPPEPRPGPASDGGDPVDDDKIPFALNVSTEPAERWWKI